MADMNIRKADRGFSAFVAGFYAAWCLRVVLLMPVDHRIETAWIRQCWSQGLRLALWVVPVVVYLKYVDKTRPAAFLKLDSLPRGRRLLWGSAIIAAFLLLTAASACLFKGGDLRRLLEKTGPDWALLLVGMSITCFTEETLFRGFIFQKLRGVWSFHPANLATSGLFLLIHWPGWLYVQGLHWGLAPLSASILVVGWVLGLVFEVSGSLWAPILLHLLNNVLSTTVGH